MMDFKNGDFEITIKTGNPELAMQLCQWMSHADVHVSSNTSGEVRSTTKRSKAPAVQETAVESQKPTKATPCSKAQKQAQNAKNKLLKIFPKIKEDDARDPQPAQDIFKSTAKLIIKGNGKHYSWERTRDFIQDLFPEWYAKKCPSRGKGRPKRSSTTKKR